MTRKQKLAAAMAAYEAADRSAWEAYEAADRSAWEAYKAARRSALEAYEAVRRPAWEAYEAVRRPAWEAYEAADRSALEAYEAADRSAREAYEAALEAYEAVQRPAWEAYEAAVVLVNSERTNALVPESHLRRLRETASEVIDALSHQGSASFTKAWDELCFLCGRHCEPYLSFKPPPRVVIEFGETSETEEVESCDTCGHPSAKGNVVYEDSGARPLCPKCNPPDCSMYEPGTATGECDGTGYFLCKTCRYRTKEVAP